MNKRIIRKSHFLIGGGIFLSLALAMLAWALYLNPRVLKVGKNLTGALLSENFSRDEVSPISGLPCPSHSRRPIAVMISSDPEARPLSGIGEADLVIEMPVITGSITRMMAVYICGEPEELGSIRSARHDFIPLAAGLDAVYAHWGGSHFALEKLKKGVLDNIDALPNLYDAFYRLSSKPAPHNGFSSIDLLLNSAKKLGYRLDNEFEGYLHQSSVASREMSDGVLEIGYAGIHRIKYEYEPGTNSYLRWRGGLAETDKNTGEQVSVKNVIIMKTYSRQIEGQYNDVEIEGKGKAVIYKKGEEIQGSWRKDKSDISGKLYFFDDKDKEIEFVSGKIWIEIVDGNQEISWEIGS